MLSEKKLLPSAATACRRDAENYQTIAIRNCAKSVKCATQLHEQSNSLHSQVSRDGPDVMARCAAAKECCYSSFG
jgi:hypothetical protein